MLAYKINKINKINKEIIFDEIQGKEELFKYILKNIILYKNKIIFTDTDYYYICILFKEFYSYIENKRLNIIDKERTIKNHIYFKINSFSSLLNLNGISINFMVSSANFRAKKIDIFIVDRWNYRYSLEQVLNSILI